MIYDEKLWKKVTYPGVRKDFYLISEDGELMSIITLKKLSPYLSSGYFRYNIVADKGSSRGFSVFAHRLVAYEYVSNPNNYPIVDHINGVKTCNHYTNLEWVTYRENSLRARKLGLIEDQGYQHSSSIYTEELARTICEKYEQGWSVKEVFRWLKNDPKAKPGDDNSLYQFAHRLKHRCGWDNITCDYNYPTHKEKRTGRWDKALPGTGNNIYSEEMIRKVCKYLEDGKSTQDILEIFTGSRTQKDNRKIYDFIDGIRRKQHWTEISCEYNIDNNSTRTRCSSWDAAIPDYVDSGLSKKEIRKKFGICKRSDNPNAAAKIDRMVDRYNAFKKVDSDKSIIILDNENDDV